MRQEDTTQQVPQTQIQIGQVPVYRSYDQTEQTSAPKNNATAIGFSSGALLILAGLLMYMFTAVNKEKNFQMEVDKEVVNHMQANHAAVDKCIDKAFQGN